MIKKDNKCSVCEAQLRDEKITYTQAIEGKVYIVTGVPAQVCTQCGETYFTPQTVEIIQKQIKQGKSKKTVEVPVYPFPHI